MVATKEAVGAALELETGTPRKQIQGGSCGLSKRNTAREKHEEWKHVWDCCSCSPLVKYRVTHKTEHLQQALRNNRAVTGPEHQQVESSQTL